MPPARTSYHHGALREALLDACLKLIETEGIGAVSLRRVAREAGVSPGAPYHHFADRAALLSALAAQGYVALAGDFAVARAGADSPVRELTALIDTYVSFALRQPAYFRLMVRPELHEPDKNPETKAAMHAAERQLQDAVQDCVAAGVIPAERAEALELTVWSIGHGLASLLLDGLLDDPSDDPSALTFQVTALLESFLRRDLSRSQPPGTGPTATVMNMCTAGCRSTPGPARRWRARRCRFARRRRRAATRVPPTGREAD